MVSSILYAFTVISSGISMYLYDILLREKGHSEGTPAFNLFLSIVGVLWLLYLIIDIKRFVHAMEKQAFGTVDLGDMKLVEGPDGELNIELTLPNEKKTLPEYYGFTSGRHSGSFFLKIGAGFFCAGHLIHMGINVIKEITFINYSSNVLRDMCSKPENMVVDFLIPLFSLLQCYFIFKFGNVIVNKNKPLARFAFMHCLSTCLCIWMYTITNETVDALVEKLHPKPSTCEESHDDDYKSDDDNDRHGLIPNCTATDKFTCSLETRYFCVSENSWSGSLFSVASMLYPFSIEFNILMVGVWYILWSNIGNISDHKNSLFFLPSVTPHGSQEALHKTQGHKEALILFADCKSSINGLFIGISIFVITVIGSIVVFILEGSCDKDLVQTSIDASNIMESTILFIMIIVSIITYIKIVGLEVDFY